MNLETHPYHSLSSFGLSGLGRAQGARTNSVVALEDMWLFACTIAWIVAKDGVSASPAALPVRF